MDDLIVEKLFEFLWNKAFSSKISFLYFYTILPLHSVCFIIIIMIFFLILTLNMKIYILPVFEIKFSFHSLFFINLTYLGLNILELIIPRSQMSLVKPFLVELYLLRLLSQACCIFYRSLWYRTNNLAPTRFSIHSLIFSNYPLKFITLSIACVSGS